MADRETQDADVGLSARVLGGLLLTVMVAVAAVAGLLMLFGGPVARAPARLPDQALNPHLSTTPLDEPAALAREKASRLRHIDEAMARLEANGWPSEEEH